MSSAMLEGCVKSRVDQSKDTALPWGREWEGITGSCRKEDI
jgi:hypothetical protein